MYHGLCHVDIFLFKMNFIAQYCEKYALLVLQNIYSNLIIKDNFSYC